MSNKHCREIVEIMRWQPYDYWTTSKLQKHFIEKWYAPQIGTRVWDLVRSWYLEKRPIPRTLYSFFIKHEGRKCTVEYILTDKWRDENIPIIIFNQYRKTKWSDRMRSCREESIVKSENKVLNEYTPPIRTNRFVRLKNILFFNKNK